MQAKQLILPQPGSLGAFADFPRDAVDLVAKADHFSGRFPSSSILVTEQPNPQIGRLADVENALALSAHNIDARLPRNGGKKLSPESKEKRTGRAEQKQLTGGHRLG
jgi:hypothetical protein